MKLDKIIFLSAVSLPNPIGGDTYQELRSLQARAFLPNTHTYLLIDCLFLKKIYEDSQHLSDVYQLKNNLVAAYIITEILKIQKVRDARWYFYQVSSFEENSFMQSDRLVAFRIEKALPQNLQMLFDDCCRLLQPVKLQLLEDVIPVISSRIQLFFTPQDIEWAQRLTSVILSEPMVESVLNFDCPIEVLQYIEKSPGLNSNLDAKVKNLILSQRERAALIEAIPAVKSSTLSKI